MGYLRITKVDLVAKKNDYFRTKEINGKSLRTLQVDWHVYRNGKLFKLVESKTYLDRCYLERAVTDFIKLKAASKTLLNSILFVCIVFGQNRGDIQISEHNKTKMVRNYYDSGALKEEGKKRRVEEEKARLQAEEEAKEEWSTESRHDDDSIAELLESPEQRKNREEAETEEEARIGRIRKALKKRRLSLVQ